MEAISVLGDPSRRRIVELLSQAPRSVNAIQKEFELSQPAVSQHLRVLREAGIVDVEIDAQRRIYRLRFEPLDEIATWITTVRRFWERRLEAMEEALNEEWGGLK